MWITEEIWGSGTLYIAHVSVVIWEIFPQTFIHTNGMSKRVKLAISFRIVRALQNTISTVVVSNACYANLHTLICRIFHIPTLRTYLNASMGRWIGISLRHNSVLALAPTNSREVVCKSIGCIRVAWCNTFSGHILAVWICGWRAYIDAKSCQWIAPVFCSFSRTIVACFNALLRHLTSKVTIGASEWAHSGESISVNRLISGAF